MFSRPSLSVPILALNRPADLRARAPAGSVGFSLAPEDDGIIAAEYLLSHGQRNALVIASEATTTASAPPPLSASAWRCAVAR